MEGGKGVEVTGVPMTRDLLDDCLRVILFRVVKVWRGERRAGDWNDLRLMLTQKPTSQVVFCALSFFWRALLFFFLRPLLFFFCVLSFFFSLYSRPSHRTTGFLRPFLNSLVCLSDIQVTPKTGSGFNAFNCATRAFDCLESPYRASSSSSFA